MKTTYRLILAAIAATAALVSCTKELNPGKVDTDPASSTLRTIAVSFEPSTKSSLSGLQPSFVAGDEIMLTNGQATDTCTVFMEGNAAKIKTSLTGIMLLATYPASCGIPNSEGVRIPTVQTGKFKDANIACAFIAENAESADFQHLVAILKFYVDESIGVKSIKITSSDESIANYDGSTSGYYNTITVSTPEGCGDLYDAMPDDGQDKRVCYVAVDRRSDSDLFANSLKFECETSTQGPRTKTPTSEVKIEKGSIYNVFMPYYINVKVSDTPEEYQKWAYCNVGAFLPEEPGLYFAWGDTEGYKWDAEKEQFEDGHSFSWENCPFTNGVYSEENKKVFTKYVPSESAAEYGYNDFSDDKTVLDLSDDAANANWGGKWRMPNLNEVLKLFDMINANGGAPTVQNGVYPIPGTQLVIPANSGYGDGETLEINDYYQFTYIWTSSVYHSVDYYPYDGVSMKFSDKNVAYSPTERHKGCPVRPIYDETLSDGGDPVALTNNPYTNGGTF